MIETATGIVLRTYPLTETSLIVHWLTPSFGRLATVAKGARNPKSSFRGKLDLFYLANFSFSRSRRSELHTLREVTVSETHSSLRRELERLEQASYCAALVELATETETPLPEIFELIRLLLQNLSRAAAQPLWVYAFEARLLQEIGLNPDLAEAKLSEGSKALLKALNQMDWATPLPLQLSPQQNRELRQFLHGFIIYHLGRVPRGRDRALAEPFEQTAKAGRMPTAQ